MRRKTVQCQGRGSSF